MTDQETGIFSHQNFNQLKYINDIPGLIFRETFENRVSVIKNGGTPTNVKFENGKAVFNGISSKVVKKISIDGTCSARIKLNVSNKSQYILDFRNPSETDSGFIYINATTGAITRNVTGSIYVNGVNRTNISFNQKNLVFLRRKRATIKNLQRNMMNIKIYII